MLKWLKRVSGKKCVSFIVSFCIKKGTELEQELLALPESALGGSCG
jgi:hypothetical protein